MDEATEKRLNGLTKLFNGFIHGHREIKSLGDCKRFLEAVCAQKDASKCVESIVASSSGLTALAKAFRFTGDSAFLNGPAAEVLRLLADPSIKQLHDGQFLHRIVQHIVDPPTFWDAFSKAHFARALSEDANLAFAWLLVELLYDRSGDLPDVRNIAERVTEIESLIGSGERGVRNLGQKIKNFLENTSADITGTGPGGRHDNDHADYRKIKILPTADEFSSTERPFYRRADAMKSVDLYQRGHLHLDNQFRLLREDLLGELRNDFQISIGAKKGRRRVILRRLQFIGIDCGLPHRRRVCHIKLQCNADIPQLKHFKDTDARRKHVADNKNLLKHHSLGCLVSHGGVVAFVSVDRNEAELSQEPPVLRLRIADDDALMKVLIASKVSQEFEFIQVDTAVFAYESVLRCLQDMLEVPLQEQLLESTSEAEEALSGIQPTQMIDHIGANMDQDLQHAVGATMSVKLDSAQAHSLLAGLSKRVSLIQGPPGTGKSFIGSLITKILHDQTQETILVITYTNHALDQFLVDIQNIGVSKHSIVRLGYRGSDETKDLSISKQSSTYKIGRDAWQIRENNKVEAEGYHDLLVNAVSGFIQGNINDKAILEYLEFEDPDFFDAFQIPDTDEGEEIAGRHGKAIDRTYLINEWTQGRSAGAVGGASEQQFPNVWGLESSARAALRLNWIKGIYQERASHITNLVQKYNRCRHMVERINQEEKAFFLKQKRIIGCTTTAAAKYTEAIREASPGIIIVEEAGEILESHILTALTSNTKQLVLIGDHKQLRPKVSNYSLTVEKGDGYDLNVSMFERLVLSGMPHTTLNLQHRMRPEISNLVRSLTYPELEDALGTKDRPMLRGFQNNVIFVSHDKPELNADFIADRRDEDQKSSKENEFEVDMVLKIVRYLGQQGYNTEQIVILTPYLGQLHRLVKTLSQDSDPWLNDLDSFELVRAGLAPPPSAGIPKQRVKICTIDNYQGEENDIVIATLTRSNSVGDIGFMASPQRVNVLLSRARDALIMIGNASTFVNSRKGKDVWVPLMKQLNRGGHVYNGFPVKCEQHPNRTASIASPDSFDEICPDGGCSEPCEKYLKCNTHKCPQRCHQLQDHSKMKCRAIVDRICSLKHAFALECHEKDKKTCPNCREEIEAAEAKRQREYQLEQERLVKQREYATKLAEIDDEMAHEKRLLRNASEDRDRKNVLAQKQRDLDNLRHQVRDPDKSTVTPALDVSVPMMPKSKSTRQTTVPPPPVPTADTQSDDNASVQSEDSSVSSAGSSISQVPPLQHHLPALVQSEAKDDWEWQKRFEGARNEALDALVAMIGLESVKQKFLAIKAKVDTQVRQNVSLKGERFGAALLGNPGTGKTTVARHYAKFLMSVGALPGDHFFETSGSKLANDGISTCKSHIDTILGAGGGVFFIDEAYQLVNGNNSGGKAVLDFLLAEMENLTGQVVFVLAGYRKQMEAFFAHNPGIPSRIPLEMKFEDYTDEELHHIFAHCVNKKYGGRMKVDAGMGGLYARIVARRIGRGRDQEGFGNARAMQNQIDRITERQAKRLRKQRRAGIPSDDHLLSKEDLIGPEPAIMLQSNKAWMKLQGMIGLQSVKDNIRVLLDSLQHNYHRELAEKPILQYSLNRCFVGSPGTGKTSVAKLYGRILADLGMLSDGEVIVKNPSDFVGDVLGATETKTKGILASSMGKVLIVDEAYMLRTGAGRNPDIFKAAVIDTIVAEVQSVPGEDRCVLLLGYMEQMEEMFRDVNPGLARRFPLDSAFVFDDFDDDDLRKILNLKLKDIGYSATDQGKKVALEALKRARNKPNFGNAGEVDILLDRAKALHQNHLAAGKTKHLDTLGAIDFDPDFDRAQRATTNLAKLFQDTVGCEDLIKRFQHYQNTAANLQSLGMDPRNEIPFNFLFKGPPGTGKTTTAQKMGKIFYDMGFLAHAKVEECSATDLIGEYVGHTGPKVQKQFEKALGKVLLIDEAYRLGEGQFAVEAMDEIVDCLTKPKFAGKLIMILAGYDHDIDRLLSKNPGLTSRFSETVYFYHLDPGTCIVLLTKDLQKRAAKAPLDLTILTDAAPDFTRQLLGLFETLSKLNSWGNGRDVKSLAKAIFGELIANAIPPITQLILTEDRVLRAIQTMIDERSRRQQAVGVDRFPGSKKGRQPMSQQPHPPQPPTTGSSASSPNTTARTEVSPPAQPKSNKDSNCAENDENVSSDEEEEPDELAAILGILNVQRDPGISDEVWEQLERDKHAAVAQEREYLRLQEEKRQDEIKLEELRRAELAAMVNEERLKLERKRMQAEIDRRKRLEELAEAEKQKKIEKERQKNVRKLGRCPMNLLWIRQSGGYRCSGGSHWLSDSDVDAYYT
ncbi:NFX1-type zinc finger-containing protein 1 (ATPase) [Paraphaeosphaeria sporulosa]